MVTPEELIKGIIRSTLQIHGVEIETRWGDDIVEQLYSSVFNSGNVASLRIIVEDLREKESQPGE